MLHYVSVVVRKLSDINITYHLHGWRPDLITEQSSSRRQCICRFVCDTSFTCVSLTSLSLWIHS
jgi:hypothetical protein